MISGNGDILPNAAVRVWKIGGIQVDGDKGFIPGNNKELVPEQLWDD